MVGSYSRGRRQANSSATVKFLNFVGVDKLYFTNARLSSWTENREKNPELSFEGQYALTYY